MLSNQNIYDPRDPMNNINNVEKIIYRGIEIKVSEGLNSYLLNFNIKDLEAIL